MHRKFFAIGLALSFAFTGSFLGWQQIQLNKERRAAMEPEPVAEEVEEEVPAYTAEVPIPELPSLDGPVEVSVTSPAAITASANDRLASLESAVQSEDAPEDSKSMLTKNRIDFSRVDVDYFEDALFVGDSRMVGIKEYGGLKEPTYFAYTGLSTFGLYGKELEVKNIGMITFEDLISHYHFGKVYIMLGINEAGSKLSDYQNKLDSIVADVTEKQPDAIIFLMANLHVTKYKSQTDKTYSNAHIDEINAAIDKIAAKYGGYYIDANFLFDDGEGNLSKDCAADYAHLKGKCYLDWIDFICSKGIVYDRDGESAM